MRVPVISPGIEAADPPVLKDGLRRFLEWSAQNKKLKEASKRKEEELSKIIDSDESTSGTSKVPNVVEGPSKENASKVDYRVNERFLEVAYSEKFDNLVRWFTNSPVIFSSLSYDKRVAKYLQSPAEEDSIVSSLKTNLKAMLDEFPESDDADSHSQEEDDDLPALDGVSFESDDKGEYGNDYHNEGVVQEEMSDTQSEAMGDVDLDDGIEVDMDGTNNQEKTKKGDVIDKRLVVGAERSSNYAKVPSKQECPPATQPDGVPHVPLIPVDPLFECFGQHHYPYNVVRPYCLPVDFLHPYTPLIPTLETPQYVLHWLQFMPSVANMEVLTNELTSNLNPNASPFVSRKVANSTPSVDVVPDSTSSNQCEDPLDQKGDTSTDNHDCTPSSDTALASPSSYVRSPLQLSTSTPLPSPKSLILDLDAVITSSPHQKEEDQSRNDVIPCEALSAYIWETWNQICTENAIWFELTQKEEDSTSQSPSADSPKTETNSDETTHEWNPKVGSLIAECVKKLEALETTTES